MLRRWPFLSSIRPDPRAAQAARVWVIIFRQIGFGSILDQPHTDAVSHARIKVARCCAIAHVEEYILRRPLGTHEAKFSVRLPLHNGGVKLLPRRDLGRHRRLGFGTFLLGLQRSCKRIRPRVAVLQRQDGSHVPVSRFIASQPRVLFQGVTPKLDRQTIRAMNRQYAHATNRVTVAVLAAARVVKKNHIAVLDPRALPESLEVHDLAPGVNFLVRKKAIQGRTGLFIKSRNRKLTQ
mmetsp:Transcript_7247/g.17753  ORF Transcript_7247/g.17753 Transcript_7247/m.17753 type:complete len:237 (+) Transcript_7247:583-1293(+)